MLSGSGPTSLDTRPTRGCRSGAEKVPEDVPHVRFHLGETAVTATMVRPEDQIGGFCGDPPHVRRPTRRTTPRYSARRRADPGTVTDRRDVARHGRRTARLARRSVPMPSPDAHACRERRPVRRRRRHLARHALARRTALAPQPHHRSRVPRHARRRPPPPADAAATVDQGRNDCGLAEQIGTRQRYVGDTGKRAGVNSQRRLRPTGRHQHRVVRRTRRRAPRRHLHLVVQREDRAAAASRPTSWSTTPVDCSSSVRRRTAPAGGTWRAR